MRKEHITLNKKQQRDLLILTVIATLTVVGLFNLFWAPVVFLLFTSYIILNKDHALTRYELLGLMLVHWFLVYSIIARMFGRGPGLMVVIPLVIVSVLLYIPAWRRIK